MNTKIDIYNFAWKEANGAEIVLMDAPYDVIQRAYNHTCDMLYNNNQYSVGKLHVKENIHKMIINCNAELCLRYLIRDREPAIMKTNKDVMDVITALKKDRGLTNADTIDKIFNDLPPQYQTLTIDKLIDACFDKLGVVNRKLISDKFIIAQGIWLTKDEKTAMTELDEKGNRKSFMEVVRQRLDLPSDVHLRVDPKGLSFENFRSLIKLETLPKVSTISAKTLELLRDKILLVLDNDIDYHINKWLDIKDAIEQIADYKHFMLKSREY